MAISTILVPGINPTLTRRDSMDPLYDINRILKRTESSEIPEFSLEELQSPDLGLPLHHAQSAPAVELNADP